MAVALTMFPGVSSVAGSLVLANSEIDQVFTPDLVVHLASSNDTSSDLTPQGVLALPPLASQRDL